MGYKVTFMDNEVYTAQDINEHFGKLFSGGVSIIESGNILADLNDMTEEIVEYGVLYDACKVVKTDSGYRISAGSAFMHDGSSITFDKDGYDFTAASGKYWYVYLERNEPENCIDVVVSETKPTGEVVPLAHITPTGKVYDRRKYAQLKINSGQAGTLQRFDTTYYLSDNFKSEPFDVGRGNFSHVIIFDASYHSTSVYGRLVVDRNNMVELTEDGEATIDLDTASYGSYRATVNFKKNGQLLETTFTENTELYDYEIHFGVI